MVPAALGDFLSFRNLVLGAGRAPHRRESRGIRHVGAAHFLGLRISFRTPYRLVFLHLHAGIVSYAYLPEISGRYIVEDLALARSLRLGAHLHQLFRMGDAVVFGIGLRNAISA